MLSASLLQFLIVLGHAISAPDAFWIQLESRFWDGFAAGDAGSAGRFALFDALERMLASVQPPVKAGSRWPILLPIMLLIELGFEGTDLCDPVLRIQGIHLHLPL